MGSNSQAAAKRAKPAGLKPLADRLGHDFADPDLLLLALTHGSAPGRRREGGDYQRLEFVGDRVLGLVMAERLYRDFPQEPEGDLTRRFEAEFGSGR